MANENSQFDPSQTQWYNATPEPEETKKPNYKKLGIIGLSIFGGLVVIVLAVFLIRNMLEPTLTAKKVVEQAVTSAQVQCQDARDVAKCLAGIPAELAQATGNGIYCKESSGDDRDLCLNAAALAANNRSICEEIKDEQRAATCSDAIIAVSLLAAGSSTDLCADYSTAELQQTCVDNILYDLAWSGDCSDQRISKVMCESLAAIKVAKSVQDPKMCDVIADADYVLACREIVGPGDLDLDGVLADEESYLGTSDTNSDSDADGLSDFDEVNTHKTNPAAADTDRDGFNDGMEIKAGYDPLN